ncbi:MAG: spore cortex-lytic enzyme [Oscillospiraceae bacterium]|nr:spore cortex-lytic enzyme [Oscillospiraceae bacterium]
MYRSIKPFLRIALLISAVFFTICSVAMIFSPDYSDGSTVAVLSKYGSRGEEVKKIQTVLKKWGYYSGSVDGIYGSKTLQAVKYFQRKNGLVEDGIAGPKTLAAMGISSSSSSSSSSDYYLLAKIISAEARGESFEGQVAVGAVVLNRVKHPSFPNTVAGVIYQPGAFSAVNDGQINQPIADSAYKAATAALNGWDPSGGAIYYYNPAKTSNKWIRSREVITVIGNHVFAK